MFLSKNHSASLTKGLSLQKHFYGTLNKNNANKMSLEILVIECFE